VKIVLPLEGCEVYYCKNFLTSEESISIFRELLEKIPWNQEKIRIFGKFVEEPRMTCWMGDAGAVYKYSGKSRFPLPWIPEVSDIQRKVNQFTRHQFNSSLLNLYRDGGDSNSWHRDNEKELGQDPHVASVNLGSVRKMQWKHPRLGLKYECELESGSLLYMGAGSQLHWYHQIPKTKKAIGPRINLTFRRVWIQEGNEQ
jgi:alkylated DNA repair dioxygenase AlkB